MKSRMGWENDVVNFTIVFDKMELHSFLDKVRKIIHIPLVIIGQDDASYICTFSLGRGEGS